MFIKKKKGKQNPSNAAPNHLVDMQVNKIHVTELVYIVSYCQTPEQLNL